MITWNTETGVARVAFAYRERKNAFVHVYRELRKAVSAEESVLVCSYLLLNTSIERYSSPDYFPFVHRIK